MRIPRNLPIGARAFQLYVRPRNSNMDFTVLVTVLSGVLTYVVGQLILKLVIEPVQDTKKTIGQISHSLIERANVISNPGVPSTEVMDATSSELRKLSSQLQAHLYLVPSYARTAKIFGLPTRACILTASRALIGLSNSVFRASETVNEDNTKRIEHICDALGIYFPPDDRLQNEA